MTLNSMNVTSPIRAKKLLEMGKGLALQFKRAFPDNFKQYQKACEAKKFSLVKYSSQLQQSTILGTGKRSPKSEI